MTSKSHLLRNKLAAFFSAATICITAGNVSAQTAETDVLTGTIWTVVDDLGKSSDWTVGAVESLLKTKLISVRIYGNGSRFEGPGPQLGGRHEISKVTLRLGTAKPKPFRVLVLELAGECIPREEVDKQHGPLKISGIPQGHSVNDYTSLSKPYGSGELTFNFAEKRRACLHSLSYSF